MKYKISIMLVILGMFLLTQVVGLFIIEYGTTPELFRESNMNRSFASSFLNAIFSFIIALTIFFFLIKYKWKNLLRIWMGFVIFLTLGIFINAVFYICGLEGNIYFYYSLLIALPFVLLKIFRNSVIVHNLTEIFIYIGLSLVFVNIFNPIAIIIILVLISFYDMWAVWQSELMQKMAKFQMNEIKIFGGFLIPCLTDKLRKKIKIAKLNKKEKTIKVPVALLGGGDVAFTLIPAGIFLKAFGWIPALFIVGGALIGLTSLFFMSEKKKFYPAMPFITLGIFIALLIYGLIFLVF